MSHIVYMFFTNKRYFSRGNSLLPTEVVGRGRQSRQQASGVARQSKKSKKRTKKKKMVNSQSVNAKRNRGNVVLSSCTENVPAVHQLLVYQRLFVRWTQPTLHRRLLDREPAVRVSGPGTFFHARQQGSDYYEKLMKATAHKVIGTKPYNKAFNVLDKCAVTHDRAYANPNLS
jgi:hypothetical protein